ncbi:MAG: FtsQ-type POTRA domain-containing protein [Heliobacteriaceae bacterium]|nr:FtsQ-type POTRA domain-containing protein [Heliobacteriaceae bacterium]
MMVKGTSLIDQDELIRLSGIRFGENIWKLNVDRVQQQLTFHPQVEAVTVKREWPSGIWLEIRERKPVAVLAQGSDFILVDQRGIFLQKVTSLHGIPLPMITGLPVPVTVGPGQTLEIDGLPVALRLCQEMSSSLILQIGEIHVANKERLVLYTGEGLEIRFGSPVDIVAKGEILTEILGEISRRGGAKTVQYVDVSSLNVPVIKTKSGGNTYPKKIGN